MRAANAQQRLCESAVMSEPSLLVLTEQEHKPNFRQPAPLDSCACMFKEMFFRICEHRRLGRACANMQSRLSFRCRTHKVGS